jgi:CheY-like chemotaxis protein
LVVEDEDEIRALVSMALGDEGYEVLAAANGAAALERLAQPGTAPPDLILLDLRMPVMDGWAFAEAYRRLPGPHAPMVAVTASRDVAASAAQIQADGFLSKPFELDDLLATVARFTGRP